MPPFENSPNYLEMGLIYGLQTVLIGEALLPKKFNLKPFMRNDYNFLSYFWKNGGLNFVGISSLKRF